MFSDLFDKASTRIHQDAAPYAEERRRYLYHLTEQGYRRAYVQRTAAVLLAAAYELKDQRLKVGAPQIESAALRAEALQRQCGKGQGSNYRRTFIRVAKRWLVFLGNLRGAQGRACPSRPQLIEFCQWMERERGFSAGTISNRRWHAQRFLCWLSSDRKRRLSKLRPADVDAFFKSLSDRGLSRITIKIYANAVRSFVRFAEQRGWCSPAIADTIRGPRIYSQHALPIGPSWEDVQRVLKHVDTDRPIDIRDRAILMLFAVYGLRANEVANLRLDDIDWEHAEIRVPRTKQRRVQTYPLAPAVGHAIIHYLKDVRPRCTMREVFIKRLAPLGPMTSRSLYWVAARASTKSV